MEDLHGTGALLTGAAGGLGRHIALALAREGVSLAVSGRREWPLVELCNELRDHGAPIAEPVVADLGDPEQVSGLVRRAEAAIGSIDLLINNAGVELAAAYEALDDEELEAMVQVNLVAPMVLARHALPGMRKRGRGHIVTISSLAGKGGAGFNVAYGTTKAGLVGLVRSLRVELAGEPVGASVICPGFVSRDGMYPRMQRLGLKAPLMLRPVPPERVARAVMDAIHRDLPEVMVTAWPLRPLLAIQEVAPRFSERIVLATGGRDFFERLAERRGRAADTAKPAGVQSRRPASGRGLLRVGGRGR